jgi:hypothetical protein
MFSYATRVSTVKLAQPADQWVPGLVHHLQVADSKQAESRTHTVSRTVAGLRTAAVQRAPLCAGGISGVR